MARGTALALPSRMNRLCLLCVTSLAAASGCYQVTMVDDVDVDFNFAPLIGASDALHSPYVRGAGMRLYARSGDGNRKMQGWTMESSDPSVFRIDQLHPDDRLSADCAAVGQGSAVVTIKNENGGAEHAGTVRVRLPDRAQLLAHGPLLIQRPDDEAVMTEAHVVKDGEGTFLVRWWAGDEQLAGHGVLSTSLDGAPPSVTAHAATTSFLEDREWLQVTGVDLGAASIALYADGQRVSSFPITVVARDAVDGVTLRGQDESGARDGDMLAALAQAKIGDEPVYGVEFAWTLDGAGQEGLGDLYRYALDSRQKKALTAQAGALGATAMIHGKDGYVDSTNHLGCAIGGRRDGAFSTVACVALALFLARRRRH